MLKVIKKIMVVGLMAASLSMLFTNMAAAHVVVKPAEVQVASRQTFSVGVPNEHDSPVVNVRLVLPDGLESVRPHAKAGWTIELTRGNEGQDAKVTEITWIGGPSGNVPTDLRDDFLFSAKVPDQVVDLKWKAYETYADGLVVAWEQEPSESEGNRPYSVTKVQAESAESAAIKEAQQAASDSDKTADRALYVAIAGVLLGISGIVLITRTKNI